MDAAHLALVAARTAGAVVLAPVFGTAFVPVPLRLLFAALFAWVLAPIVPSAAAAADPLIFAVALIGEAAAGALLGWTAALVLYGIQTAGQLMDQEISFMGARPAGEDGPTLFATFQLLVGTVVFLLVDGHHLFLSALHESFFVWPTGGGGPSPEAAAGLALPALASVLSIAVKIAAPVLLAGLVVTIAGGLAARVCPTVNLLPVALGSRALFLLAVMAATAGAGVYLMGEEIGGAARAWAGGVGGGGS